MTNFVTALLTSVGTPMILGGDEFRRTQRGNNNAYCQDNEIAWFDWTLAQKNKSLVDFTSRLIKFRKAHPCLSRTEFFGESESEKRNGVEVIWYDYDGRIPDWSKLSRFLAYEIYGSRFRKSDGGFDNDLYFAINTDTHDMNLILPSPAEGKVWARALDTSFPDGEEILEEGKEEILGAQNRYVIPAKSYVILVAVERR